jgi:translocation and assembly module TamA
VARGEKKSRSRARRVLLGVVVLVVVLAAATIALLKAPPVGQRIVDAALRKAGDASGLAISARERSLDTLGGRLRLGGLVVGLPGEPPFLSVDAAEAELLVGEALRGRFRLRFVTLEGVRLDLGAPRPASEGPSATDLPFLSAAEIERFRIEGATVLSGPLPEALRAVALSASASDVRLDGDLRGGTLRLRGETSRIVVERPGGLRLGAKGDVTLTASADGALVLEALHVDGDGLSLSAFGSGGLSPEAPLGLRAEATLDPARLAPELEATGSLRISAKAGGRRAAPTVEATLEGRDLATKELAVALATARVRFADETLLLESAQADLREGGRVEGDGRFLLATGDGSWNLRATGLPDTLLGRYADPATRERWGIAGATLDAVATVRHGRGEPQPLEVDATATLARDGGTLAEARAGLVARGDAKVDVVATFLPDSPGKRTAEGRVRAASLAGLSSGRIEAGRVVLDVPDAAEAVAELGALFPARIPEVPEGVDLAGPLRLDADVSGPLRAPRATIAGTFRPARGGALSLVASADGARGSAEGRLTAAGLDLASFHPGGSGLASADTVFALSRKDRRAFVVLDAADLCLSEESPRVDAFHATLALDGSELSVLHLAAASAAAPSPAGVSLARFDASGRLSLAAPFEDADLEALLFAAGLPAEVHAVVRDGVLALDVPSAGFPGLAGTLAARVPLGALRELPALADAIPAGLPEGPIEVTLEAPGLDACALGPLLPPGTEALAARGDLRLFATFGLADPLAGTAAIEVEGLTLESPAGPVLLRETARVVLGGGRLALAPVTVDGERTSFTVAAEAELLPNAPLRGPLESLVAHLSATARGRADAALLTPFLAGGIAKGEIAVDASASGPPDALAGRVLLDGKGARFTWPVAYPTELRDPLLEAELAPGQVELTRGEALLNGGPLRLEGGWYSGVGATATARFSDVRYRLAYGLASVLSGTLTFDQLEDGRRLSGTVVLERGLLERDVDLDREVLALVLAPPESPGTEASFLDTLALDLGITTASGVRIRNNVADLAASWSRLDVSGTASRPVVRGRIDVERGGLVFAYGQTFRIDRGVVTYSGDPQSDPRLDFVTTSSLEDPSIAAGTGGSDLFASARRGASDGTPSDDAAAALAEGLAGYYGNRLAGSLGAALGRVSLSVRPLLLLGETDAAARLTLSRDFSPNVSLAVGIDLKNAQRQTWVVDVHGLRRLPPLSVQAFTEDYGRFGGTLQQRIELGGTREGEGDDVPLVGAVRATAPAGVSRRSLVSALGLRKGEPAGKDALFEAEIDAEAFLRGKGWPDAQVSLRAVPSRKAGRVDVEVDVDAGPRAELAFEGDRLPAAARREVASLYRTGLLEPASLGDMRRAAARALRARGHLSPAIEVEATGPEEERRVVVRVAAGRRAAIRELRFEGVGPREALFLGRRFATPLERTELAAGLASADARLLEGLRALGYPYADLGERELFDDGRLVVRVERGDPSLVDSVEIRDASPEERERFTRLVRLAPGDVADSEKTALSALAIEEALRAEGYATARVRATLSPATPEIPPRLALAFAVERGPAQRIGSVRLEGFSRTSPKWATRVAGLSPGDVFRRSDLDAARAGLFSLGQFRSVRGDLTTGPDGRVDVVLSAEELPPVTLAYGVRWENERGLSAVVDASDRNLFGRGIVAGVRGLYDPEDRALRLFAGLPEQFLGAGIDLWVERRRSFREGLFYGQRTDAVEASLQLSRSFGKSLSARLYGRFKETRYFEDDIFFPIDVTIRLPYLGVQLVHDTREDPMLGTNGVLATLDLQSSGSWLGSSFAFGRAYGQLNLYRPVFALGSGKVVWAQSVRAGFARAFEGQELIPDVRFYAGGSYSVRGYGTESLGPREDLGGTLYVTGGSTLLVVNEEIRVPLHPRVLGVGFFDAGQVWESSRDFGTGLATSVGLGVRALTPLGVLRLDGAVPLKRREGDPAWRVTFGFGNVF